MSYKEILTKNLSVKTVTILGIVFTLASLLLKNPQLSLKVAIFFVFAGLLSYWESRASQKREADPNSSFNSKVHKFYFSYLFIVLILVIIFAVAMLFYF